MTVGWQMYGGNTLIDVVCLKVGMGYKHRYVNELFKQVKKTTKINDFICITDNSRGIDPDINIKMYKPIFNERMWWNKVSLFEPGMFENDTIYLDLDCYVHGNLQEFVDGPGDILHTSWFNKDVIRYIFSCSVNSSVMYINQSNYEPLWRDFQDNKMKLYKSFYGLDSWIYRRHLDKLKFFLAGMAYSYRYGSNYPYDCEPEKIREDHLVCSFDDIVDKESKLKELWNV